MFLTILTFLLILSLLIFVHELGHFLVAKKTGIGVEEFGFGLPPKVVSLKFGETVYSLNWLPIGGFVKLRGEEQESERVKEQEGMFWAKPKKIRTAVIVAGVLMNFLLAVVAFSVVYTKIGIPTQTDQVKVVGIAASSPAELVDIKEGDIVLAAAGTTIKSTREFIEITKKYAGQAINLEIRRQGENMMIIVIPRENPPAGEGPLGIAISAVEMRFYPFWQMPFRGTIEGFKEAFAWTGMIVAALGMMLWQLVSAGTVPKDVAGPVGIFQITGQVAKSGVLSVFQFLGILSVNLAVINILPIPALDGGRLLFIGIEAITGRRVRAKVERWTHQIGMIILLFLILMITYNDVLRIWRTTKVGEKIQQLLPLTKP